MKIPDGMTEAEVVVIIDKVVTKLSRKLTFGYSDMEDLQQDGRLFAWEGLARFNAYHEGIKGLSLANALEHFLRVHVVNRLKNVKRKHMGRIEKPKNPLKIPAWEQRNKRKKNIMEPDDIENFSYELFLRKDPHEQVYYNEMMERINLKLPVELRSDFLRMRDGLRIPTQRQNRVREAIAEILGISYEKN